MFGIGGMELLVILLVALLVLGPERLPQITKWLAKVTREIRRASDEVRMHLDPDLIEYAEKRSNFFNRNVVEKEKDNDEISTNGSQLKTAEKGKILPDDKEVVFLKKDGE